VTRFPADRSKNVDPDTHLVLTFPETPTLGAAGQIRMYDAANDRLARPQYFGRWFVNTRR